MFPLVGMQANHVWLLIGIGIGLFLFVLIRRVRRGFNTSSTQPYRWSSSGESGATAKPTNRELIGSARLRSIEGSAGHEQWEVEMHDLARQLKGEIDTKMRALERLIQISDEATVRLDAAIERAEQVGVIVEQRHTRSASRTAKPDEQLVGASAKRTESKPMRRPVPQSALVGAGVGVPQNLDDDPRFERVYALADGGFTAVKIAGQIGAQVGEVELILSLRRR